MRRTVSEPKVMERRMPEPVVERRMPTQGDIP